MSPDRGPAPFQFGLRAVLATMLFAAVVFAVWRGLGPLWGPTTAWVIVLASAHVAGNAWGSWAFARRPEPSTHRNLGDNLRNGSLSAANKEEAETSRPPEQRDLSATRRERTAFTAATALGVALGAGCGLSGWSGEPWTTFTLTGMAVASVSLAALGGLIGALAALAGPAVWRAVRQSG